MKKLTCTEKAFIKSYCDEISQGKGGGEGCTLGVCERTCECVHA